MTLLPSAPRPRMPQSFTVEPEAPAPTVYERRDGSCFRFADYFGPALEVLSPWAP